MAKLLTKIITVKNRKTSMRLAKDEWEALELICAKESIKRDSLIELIETYKNSQIALTSSVRLFSTVYLYNLQVERDTPNYASVKRNSSSPIFNAIKSIL